ncbi:hypothetical protein H0H92_006158, partial [Tricholoma furcatifolium]
RTEVFPLAPSPPQKEWENSGLIAQRATCAIALSFVEVDSANSVPSAGILYSPRMAADTTQPCTLCSSLLPAPPPDQPDPRPSSIRLRMPYGGQRPQDWWTWMGLRVRKRAEGMVGMVVDEKLVVGVEEATVDRREGMGAWGRGGQGGGWGGGSRRDRTSSQGAWGGPTSVEIRLGLGLRCVSKSLAFPFHPGATAAPASAPTPRTATASPTGDSETAVHSQNASEPDTPLPPIHTRGDLPSPTATTPPPPTANPTTAASSPPNRYHLAHAHDPGARGCVGSVGERAE